MSPPPPAIASIKPAAVATKNRANKISTVISTTHPFYLKRHQRGKTVALIHKTTNGKSRHQSIPNFHLCEIFILVSQKKDTCLKDTNEIVFSLCQPCRQGHNKIMVSRRKRCTLQYNKTQVAIPKKYI